MNPARIRGGVTGATGRHKLSTTRNGERRLAIGWSGSFKLGRMHACSRCNAPMATTQETIYATEELVEHVQGYADTHDLSRSEAWKELARVGLSHKVGELE